MRLITFYGKGGIGKSTVAAAVATLFRNNGGPVLHVGCDPKHDASLRHAPRRPVPTVMDELTRLRGNMGPRELEAAIVAETQTGVHVLECGGPEPGRGCAGRAVSLALNLLEASERFKGGYYDTVILDVLGDVVCGGFAAPLRASTPADVVLVVSRDFMSLYAANNIAKGIGNLTTAGHSRLVGVIGNRVDDEIGRGLVHAFAEQLGTRVLGIIPFDAAVFNALHVGGCAFDTVEGGSAYVRACQDVYEAIRDARDCDRVLPTPFEDEELGRTFARAVDVPS